MPGMNPANETSIAQSEETVLVPRLHWWRYSWTGAQASTTSATCIHTTITLTTSIQVFTDMTQPTCPRALSVTGAAAQTGDTVTIRGTDIHDHPITEIITTVASTKVAGLLAFKSITSLTCSPYVSGSTPTLTVGDTNLLGLPVLLPAAACVFASYKSGTLEGTAATVTVSTTIPAANTILLNSSLDGSIIAAIGYIYG